MLVVNMMPFRRPLPNDYPVWIECEPCRSTGVARDKHGHHLGRCGACAGKTMRIATYATPPDDGLQRDADV
jgi:hypothetical protein